MVAAPPRWSASCRLPISGVSAEVFRLAQLTVWRWWPTIALPIGTSRLFAADGMVITTTVDCTHSSVSSERFVWRSKSSWECNPSCVQAFHRVGGWGVRPATRFVRTSLSFQLPAGH